MATNSPILRLTLQDTGENPNSWGAVANAGVFQLLEDSVSGVVNITANGVNRTLTTANGAVDEARKAVLHITGPAASDLTIFIPALSKLYAVVNASDSDISIQVVGASGTPITVTASGSQLIYCDGVDVLSASEPTTVANADLATNSLQLGAVVAANYARVDQNQTFNGGQSVARKALVIAAGATTPNANDSNTFYLLLTANITMNNPSNPVDGQTLRIAIEQDGTGGRTISWGSAYAWGSAVAPVISPAANAVDYISLEYVGAISKWVGGFIQEIG